jgi:TetR/AcrR family transcriptional repressor of nem operon
MARKNTENLGRPDPGLTQPAQGGTATGRRTPNEQPAANERLAAAAGAMATTTVVNAATRKGKATRAEILRVAKALFSVHGYHATGIADVFEATGLSKGAFYYHFGTKEDLALAILDEVEAEYDAKVFAAIADQPSPGSKLRALLARALALNRSGEWNNCQLVMTFAAELTETDGRLPARVAEIQRIMYDALRRLIAEGQETGEVRDDVASETLAQWVVFTMAGFILAKKFRTERVPAEQIFDRMMAYVSVR